MSTDFNAKFSSDATFNAKFGGVQMIHTDNYDDLYNHPSIEGNELIGDKTFKQLGLDTLTVQEVQAILYNNDKRRKHNG